MYLTTIYVSLGWLFSFLVLINQEIISQPIPQRTSLIIRENLLYIPIRINGRGPYYFRLDASASGTVGIDNRLAKELGLKIVGFQEITEGNQRKRAFLVGVDKLNLGSITRSNLQVRVGDYNQTVRQLPVDGTIGLDFFASYRLQLDGPANQLTVSADALTNQSRSVLSYAKPYLIPGKIGSKEVLFNLDVGSTCTVLFPTAMLAGIHYVDTPDGQLASQTNPSFFLQEAVITDEIVLGGIHIAHQKIYHSSKVHQITLGIGFLKEHTVNLDQRRKLIELE